jgi:hypothetical protein
MSVNEQDISISYYVEEIENQNNEKFNIDDLMNEIDRTELHNHDITITHMINYHENYTVKELLFICEYYGFAKQLKNAKLNKEQIIDFLVNFESDRKNADIVFKRQNMWFYMNELKSDKFMKKYFLL